MGRAFCFLLSAFCCPGVVCCLKVLRFPISVPRSGLNSSGRERKKTLSSTNEYQYPIVFDAHITVMRRRMLQALDGLFRNYVPFFAVVWVIGIPVHFVVLVVLLP